MLLRGTTVALQCGVYKAAHISSCRPIPDPNMRVSIAYLAVAVANGVCSSCMVVAVAGRLTCDVQHTRWGVCHCWSAGESVPRYGYVYVSCVRARAALTGPQTVPPPSTITSRSVATSLATTLLGGGLALLFT